MVSDKDFADDQWHTYECICAKGSPIRTTIDGQKLKEQGGTDQSNFDWCTRINFGWSADRGGYFTGQIKNFKYSGLPEEKYALVEQLWAL